jgi:hypothetical protein
LLSQRVLWVSAIITALGTAPELLAQPVAACEGIGVAGATLSERVVVNYVHQDCRGPERELRAVVLWRGQPRWNATRASDAGEAGDGAARMRAVRDSARGAGAATGGGHAPGLFWGVLVEQASARVVPVVWSASAGDARLPGSELSADSVTVLLVDRVDGVGGPPTLTAVARVGRARTTGLLPPTRVPGSPRPQWAPDPAGAVRRLLAGVPAVAEYLR